MRSEDKKAESSPSWNRFSLLLLLLLLPPPALAAELRSELFVSGLSLPVGWAQDPADPAVQYVIEQGGRIRVIEHGALRAVDFLDLTGVVACCGERGLLGLALPPDHAASGRFYVNFTDLAGNTVVARFRRAAADPAQADPESRFDLRWPSGERFIAQPYANHNGGALAFGPDGYLYLGLGDGGAGDDPEHRAQDPATLLGKMLRIDVAVPDDDPNGYRIPPDNPFAGGHPVAALAEIWSFGWRNPWRFSFDDPARGGTGALLAGDVGQGAWEEINYEPPLAGGRNYGWRLREGAHPHLPFPPPAFLPLTDPIQEYSHAGGAAVTGGFVYRGRALPARFQGRYFYADFIRGQVWSIGLVLDPVTGEATATDLEEHTAALGGSAVLGNISAFGVDAQGEIYLFNYGAGTIVKVADWNPSGDLVADFGPGLGIHALSSERVWTPVHPLGARRLTGGDLDGDGRREVVIDFGAPHGIWTRDRTGWIQLHPLTANQIVAADLDGDGRAELVADFPGSGIWAWRRDAGWTQLHGLNASALAAGDLDGDGRDEVAAHFPGRGLWTYWNDSAWRQLQTLNGGPLITGDFDASGRDDLVVNFHHFGLYAWANNAVWVRLQTPRAERLAVGDLGPIVRDDLVGDFGPAFGLWVLRAAARWTRLHTLPTEDLVMGDLDRNGRDDVVVDFGPEHGLWGYLNDTTWVQLHSLSPRSMTFAHLE